MTAPTRITPGLSGAPTEVDVLVVGLGVTGAGVALDAVSRGLSVLAVDAHDLAFGTSRFSSKLVHGGLRYLEMLDFPLVHEALRERGRLVEDIAPHLVRPVPFLYPLAKAWERPYVGAGLALYDGMAAGRTGHLPVHRHLGRAAVSRIAPGLRPESHVGAIRYYDAQVDDARLVIELVRTAMFVPTFMPVGDLLQSMRASRVHMAIVVDEYGGTSGMMTVEDIVEELFGEIEDEHDSVVLTEEKLGEEHYLFSARLEVDYLNENYKLNIPEGENYETLGGFILNDIEEIPPQGGVVEIGRFKFIIKEVSNTKIELVEVEIIEQE